MGIFSLWRSDDEPARDIEKELAEHEKILSDKRKELVHIDGELAALGTLTRDEYHALAEGNVIVEREIVHLEARIALLKKDLAAAQLRDRQAAVQAKVAEFNKRAPKQRAAAIKREAEHQAAALAASSEIEAVDAEQAALAKEAAEAGVDGPAALAPREMTLRMALVRAAYFEQENAVAEERARIWGPPGTDNSKVLAEHFAYQRKVAERTRL